MSDKYKKFLGKDTDEKEQETIKTQKDGIVEREKKVIIVNESGQKKQLLREQV